LYFTKGNDRIFIKERVMIKFTKMHGTGNDYILIDARKKNISNPTRLAKEMSNRHWGVGSDGLILILKSKCADFKMRIFNADGTEAEMCGNGIRCFGKYVFEHGLTKKNTLTIETPAGLKKLNLSIKKNKVHTVRVNMGEPILQREKIPMRGESERVIDEVLVLNGVKFKITAISMGNPHVVVYVEDVKGFPVEKYGPMIENHPIFPRRTNVEFVEIVSENELIQRTWERGSGETLACGTGASAVTVAGVLNNKTSRKTTIILKGGTLKINWDERDNNVYLTGPAVEVFEGRWKE
jgi:diaminopimelate epimerase